MNDCNDYSLLASHTGITALSGADPSLTGAGASFVFAAGSPNGSIVKSIIIKAAQASLQGMVRIYIKDPAASVLYLYKEVPIPPTPSAPSVPVPTPQYIMYETILQGDLKLNAGFEIWAATQNKETFNIFVEGLDWTYPTETPTVCCNFEQDVANTGLGIVSQANPSLDGTTGSYSATIFTAGSPNGAFIKNVTIKALQNTHEGVVRLFVNNGTTWYLMREIWIPETTQSAYDPSFKQVITLNYNLQSGYLIRASTQNSESFAITIEAENWIYP